ncbi:MAG: T9SS type A sorting domain-containing protein [Bacteroidota bacterium]
MEQKHYRMSGVWTLYVLVALCITVNMLQGQWINVNNGISKTDIISVNSVGEKIFVGTNSGLFVSTDQGNHWNASNSGLENSPVWSMAISGNNFFAGSRGLINSGNGVFLSTDGGATWKPVNTGLSNVYVQTLALSGTNLFAGGWGGGVFLSTNNGQQWSEVNTGITSLLATSLAVYGKNIFCGTSGYIFLSTNNGSNWNPISTGMPYGDVNCLTVSDTNIFAGTNAGVYRWNEDSASWSAVNTGLANTKVTSFAQADTILFAGTEGGMFFTTDNGSHWASRNHGLKDSNIVSLSVSGSNLFAATKSDGMYRISLSSALAVKETPKIVPDAYAIDQNYPNPFNPATTIRYSLPNRSRIRIVVANSLGQQLSVLEEGEKEAGSYDIQWRAPYGSGIYFCRIEAIDVTNANHRFSRTIKMLLVK